MLAHPIAPVAVDDPVYMQLLADEAAFWNKPALGFMEIAEAGGGTSPIDRYENRRFTGDEATPWHRSIASRGRFKRGLFLGTSGLAHDAAILETNTELHATIVDIADVSLERWRQNLERRFPGRVSTRRMDLNFAEFEEDSFDLIVSAGTLHHIMNLDRLAGAINRALTIDGRFFLYDYVGESRYAFSEDKKRSFEVLFQREARRGGRNNTGLRWLNEDRARYSPLCGVRAHDILPTLRNALVEKRLRVAGSIVGLMLFTEPLEHERMYRLLRLRQRVTNIAGRVLPFVSRATTVGLLSKEFLDELILVDEVVSETGMLEPFSAFAEYEKSV